MYMHIMLERDDLFGEKEMRLYTYITFVQYERWKEKGRSVDGKRSKCKMIVYDLDLKKVKTKSWSL